MTRASNAGLQRYRVVLADDHVVFRDGLKLMLSTLPELEIVAELADLESLKSTVQTLDPDLLVLDYHMPGGDSGATLAWLRQRYPSLKLVMLTGAQSPLVLRQLVELGADGVLLKQGSGSEIVSALRQVLAGQRVVVPAVQALLAEGDVGLTPRELQIIQLVCDGLSNTVIAERLKLSPKTVDKHRENLMRKLEVSNVAQLIKKVLSLKLLDLESPGS